MSLRWLRFADNFNILRITFEWLNINACTWVEITLKWSPNIVDKSRHMFFFYVTSAVSARKRTTFHIYMYPKREAWIMPDIQLRLYTDIQSDNDAVDAFLHDIAASYHQYQLHIVQCTCRSNLQVTMAISNTLWCTSHQHMHYASLFVYGMVHVARAAIQFTVGCRRTNEKMTRRTLFQKMNHLCNGYCWGCITCTNDWRDCLLFRCGSNPK